MQSRFITRFTQQCMRASGIGWCLSALSCASGSGAGPSPGDRSVETRRDTQSDQLSAHQSAGVVQARNGTECGDGIDNDGDGYVDAAFDPGCYSSVDPTEAAGRRSEEAGFTTFEFGPDSRIVYVSNQGSDSFDGSSPERAVATLTRAAGLVRDGHHDFILLRRGDTFRDQELGRFKSGRDAEHPLVIASYGHASELPRIELTGYFIDHNGATRSNLALLDLHLVQIEKDPEDPAFTGTGSGGLRFVGSGQNLLVEGCHLEYVELIVQSYGKGGKYENVSVRHNVVEKSYHAGTCVPGDPRGNIKLRPSGMYASHVEGLNIEGNLFDHNGWNEDVETACATIYNHNVYLNANGLKLVDNIFARASSMHVKLRSDRPRDMIGTEISDNFFIQGEIGISMGGEGRDPARFVDTKISSNVFYDIGRSQPTQRGLAWGVDTKDHENLLIEKNLFLRREGHSGNNTYGLQLGGTQRTTVARDNLFYGGYGRSLSIFSDAGHTDVSIIANRFFDPGSAARFVEHAGPLVGYTYENNGYLASEQARFRVGKNKVHFNEWKVQSGDDQAHELDPVADPQHSLESYSESLGYGATLEQFLNKATKRSRLLWDERISARLINAHLRQNVMR